MWRLPHARGPRQRALASSRRHAGLLNGSCPGLLNGLVPGSSQRARARVFSTGWCPGLLKGWCPGLLKGWCPGLLNGWCPGLLNGSCPDLLARPRRVFIP